MSTYTISKGVHRRWNTDTDAEIMCFEVEDEKGTKAFQVRIARKIFDMLTDQQVTDYIMWCCEWHKRRFVDNDVTSPVDSPTLNTRATRFVNKQITVS